MLVNGCLMRLRPVRRGLAPVVLCGFILASMPACGVSRTDGGGRGRIELSYRLDGPRPGHVRVHLGDELVITLERAPGHAWSAVESLQPHVVRVLRSSGRGETVTAVARAASAGEAELRWTSSFTGDPYGPPTLLWRLTVTVVS